MAIVITLTTIIMVISFHTSENIIKSEPHERKWCTSKSFRAPHQDATLKRVRGGAGKKEAKTEECEARERNISHTLKNSNTDREKDKSYVCQEKGERPLSAYG